jgi:hemerythrin
MGIVEFTEQYSVKVKSLDEQHRKLFDLINRLSEAMKASRGKDALGEVFKELDLYIRRHFSREEKYMRQFNYDGAAAHISEHVRFVMRVKAFREEFASGQLALSVRVINYLKQWLIKHILGTDRKYSACFLEHGLE